MTTTTRLSTPSRWRRAVPVALVLAAGSLALGACASGGDATPESTTTAASAPETTTSLPSAGASRTTADGITIDVVSESVVTPATGCSMLTDQWRQANPGQEPPTDLCEIPVDSRRFTATADDRTAALTVPVPSAAGTTVAMTVAGQRIDGPLTLVVVNVSPDVASVTVASGSQPVSDAVAPADGLAAVAVLDGYDRIEARDAEGRVLTACFAEPLADAGGQCLSQAPPATPETTTPETTTP